MQIGLTFDEFVELMIKQRPDADPAFHRSAEIELARLFPMNTAAASTHLRRRGYDCKPPMLEYLVQEGIVTLSQPDAWTQSDVDAAAQYFEQCEVFTPYAAMCQTLGCSYAGFLRPLREASERESRKYGRYVPDTDQYFVMHRVPPRSDTDSIITFTLCPDIQERLERGEEV